MSKHKVSEDDVQCRLCHKYFSKLSYEEKGRTRCCGMCWDARTFWENVLSILENSIGCSGQTTIEIIQYLPELQMSWSAEQLQRQCALNRLARGKDQKELWRQFRILSKQNIGDDILIAWVLSKRLYVLSDDVLEYVESIKSAHVAQKMALILLNRTVDTCYLGEGSPLIRNYVFQHPKGADIYCYHWMNRESNIGIPGRAMVMVLDASDNPIKFFAQRVYCHDALFHVDCIESILNDLEYE